MRNPAVRLLLCICIMAGLSSPLLSAESPEGNRPAIKIARATEVPRSTDGNLPTAPPQFVTSEKIDALRSAATSLTKAGFLEEAAKLNERAAALEKDSGRALLLEKLKQLDALQAEVDALRKIVGNAPQILIKVQLLEIDRDRIGEVADQRFHELLGNSAQPTFHLGTASDPAKLQATLKDLLQRRVVKVLAEPTLVTVLGRQAFLNTGGEFPVKQKSEAGPEKVEYKQYGTKIDFLPSAVGNDRVRLDMKLRQSELVGTADTNSDLPPGLRIRQFDTSYECRWNEAIVLRGLMRRQVEPKPPAAADAAPVPGETELLVIVTPEAVRALD